MNSGMWELIQQYITGNGSPEDDRKVEEWMKQDLDNRQLINELKQIWKLTPEEEFDVDVQRAWQQFCSHKLKTERKRKYDAFRKKRSNLVYYFRAAAVILIAVLTGFFTQYYFTHMAGTGQQSPFYVMQDLVTSKGERARVTFSDGTMVVLNAASTLRFPEKFDGSKREVYLDGGAYFEVAHNAGQPFIVHTQGAVVKVLGTKFNVRAWSEDPEVAVTVSRGKVAVSSSLDSLQNHSEVILTKGQHTSIKQGEAPAAPQEVNINNHLLWVGGGLYFDNAPFEQAVRQIERKFDVRITVQDKELLDVPYTGTFKRANLDEVLRVISASMGMEYSRKGPEIEFRSANRYK